MNRTRLRDEPHRPGTPWGVRPATGTPAAPPPTQATGSASPGPHTRPALRPASQPCHRPSARRRDGRTPSATFAQITFPAYPGFGLEATSAAVPPRQRSFPGQSASGAHVAAVLRAERRVTAGPEPGADQVDRRGCRRSVMPNSGRCPSACLCNESDAHAVPPSLTRDTCPAPAGHLPGHGCDFARRRRDRRPMTAGRRPLDRSRGGNAGLPAVRSAQRRPSSRPYSPRSAMR